MVSSSGEGLSDESLVRVDREAVLVILVLIALLNI